jgi:hypothetical protein
MCARDAKNKIRHLWSENGRKVDDIAEIKIVVGECYKKLIGRLN